MTDDTGSRRARGEALLRSLSQEGADRLAGAHSDLLPDLPDLILGYVFGEIYTRSPLTVRDRQIATLATLAAMGGTEPQLDLHITISLDSGMSREDILETFLHVSVYAGYPRALNAIAVAREVLARRERQAKEAN